MTVCSKRYTVSCVCICILSHILTVLSVLSMLFGFFRCCNRNVIFAFAGKLIGFRVGLNCFAYIYILGDCITVN